MLKKCSNQRHYRGKRILYQSSTVVQPYYPNFYNSTLIIITVIIIILNCGANYCQRGETKHESLVSNKLMRVKFPL